MHSGGDIVKLFLDYLTFGYANRNHPASPELIDKNAVRNLTRRLNHKERTHHQPHNGPGQMQVFADAGNGSRHEHAVHIGERKARENKNQYFD